MNRKVALGVLFFFAIVGIALMGGEKAAVAGHGCHGCAGVVACGGCDGEVACHGLKLFQRCQGVAPACCGKEVAPVCHGRVRCHGLNLCQGLNRCEGRRVRCCGPAVNCGCNGEAAPAAPAEAAPEKAPEKVPEAPKAASLHAPMSFYQVSFRQ